MYFYVVQCTAFNEFCQNTNSKAGNPLLLRKLDESLQEKHEKKNANMVLLKDWAIKGWLHYVTFGDETFVLFHEDITHPALGIRVI